jgi:hypothetical protein
MAREIVDKLVHNNAMWREYVARSMKKEDVAGRMPIEGFPDKTLDALRACGFTDLLRTMVAMYPSPTNHGKCAYAIGVPSQMRLEGFFGTVREQSPNHNPSPGQ